eukprot:Gb_35740 [translate_table: standard]
MQLRFRSRYAERLIMQVDALPLVFAREQCQSNYLLIVGRIRLLGDMQRLQRSETQLGRRQMLPPYIGQPDTMMHSELNTNDSADASNANRNDDADCAGCCHIILDITMSYLCLPCHPQGCHVIANAATSSPTPLTMI